MSVVRIKTAVDNCVKILQVHTPAAATLDTD